jgi:hypothetical protein
MPDRVTAALRAVWDVRAPFCAFLEPCGSVVKLDGNILDVSASAYAVLNVPVIRKYNAEPVQKSA